MSCDPVLILQMQRMGDLILTFPLLLDLQKLWPEQPIWVVAEKEFFQPLLPFSPKVSFFAPSMPPSPSKRADIPPTMMMASASLTLAARSLNSASLRSQNSALSIANDPLP